MVPPRTVIPQKKERKQLLRMHIYLRNFIIKLFTVHSFFFLMNI